MRFLKGREIGYSERLVRSLVPTVADRIDHIIEAIALIEKWNMEQPPGRPVSFESHCVVDARFSWEPTAI
jgi:hypothetical protein